MQLDDAKQRIIGSETITYFNNSPDTLIYLWVQLDQNIFGRTSDANLTQSAPEIKREPAPNNCRSEKSTATEPAAIAFNSTIDQLLARSTFDGGYRITAVRDAKGAPSHTPSSRP